MTYHPKPFRSDRHARIQYILHHHILEITIVFCLIVIPIGLWLGSDYSPIEILRARGSL